MHHESKSFLRVCLFLLILQGSQRELQPVREDLQLLGKLVLLPELLPQEDQVSGGIMKRDITQVQTPPSQIVQVHHAATHRQRQSQSGNHSTAQPDDRPEDILPAPSTRASG